jgi:hypothetical protein
MHQVVEEAAKASYHEISTLTIRAVQKLSRERWQKVEWQARGVCGKIEDLLPLMTQLRVEPSEINTPVA